MSEGKIVVDALTGAKSLPMKEKLKVLDQEIRKLHKACTEAGYEPEKIRKIADPVLKTARRGNFKKTAKMCLLFLIGTIAFGGFCYAGSKSLYVRVITKKFMVYWVLPHYDWTWAYLNDCLIANPYYYVPEEEFTEDSCLNCEKIKELKAEFNVDPDTIADRIYGYEPSIIGDAMTDWRSTKQNVDLSTFIKLYATDERTMNLTGVKKTSHFRTTRDIPANIKNVTALAKWLYAEEQEGVLHDFTAQWANVDSESAKAIHYFYTKPYFLPSMCETIRQKNYFMMARRQTEEKGKGLIMRSRFSDMGIWIAQVYGRYEFILEPISICKEMCTKLRFVLEQGQMLNVPTGLYTITYRPNSTESVAIGVGYEFQ